MDRRSQHTAGGGFPASPHPYYALESQINRSPSQYLGASNTAVSSPGNPSPEPYLHGSERGISENVHSLPTQQSGYGGPDHEQRTRQASRNTLQVGRTLATRGGQRRHYLTAFPALRGSRRQATGSARTHLPEHYNRQQATGVFRDAGTEAHKKNKAQRMLQDRLESQANFQPDAEKSAPYQTIGAMNVFNTEGGVKIPVVSMFYPGMEYSAVHPQFLRSHVLNIRASSVAQESLQNIFLPHGEARASRSINLVVENLRYGITASVETLRVLDDDTPYRAIDIYFGRRFLKEHCDGKVPDIYFGFGPGKEAVQASMKTEEEMESLFTRSVASTSTPTTTATSWESQNLHTNHAMNADHAWSTGMTTRPEHTAPLMEGLGQHQSYHMNQGSIRLPIRQDQPWAPSSGSGQMGTGFWPPSGQNIGDPTLFLDPVPDHRPDSYVNSAPIGGNYMDPSLFLSPSQHSASYHGSTSDHGMSTEDDHEMGSETYNQYNYS